MPGEKEMKAQARAAESKAAAANIESDVERMRGEASSLKASVTDYGAAKMDQYRETAANTAEEISQQARESLAAAKSELARIERQLVHQVEVNPLKAVAIAAAAGFLAALLFRR